MSLWAYRFDALYAHGRALCWRLSGMRIGRRAKVHAGVVLRAPRAAVALGESAEIYAGNRILCTAGGRFVLGVRSHLAPGGHLLVGARSLVIGDRVAIGPHAIIVCESNGVAGREPFVDQHVGGDIRIGNNVFLGARVTVLPGAVIEDDVVVGAHAVVRGRLPSGWVYAGVPARPLRRLDRAVPAPAEASV
jgi:acetyltransferase-like isoleucine patch superfamily enzyme